MKKAKSHGAMTSLGHDLDTYAAGGWLKPLEPALPSIDFFHDQLGRSGPG